MGQKTEAHHKKFIEKQKKNLITSSNAAINQK